MRILVVRRDNIGDLILTTPVFTALKRHFPGSRIEALVNSYNAPAIAGHPDLDAVHVYTKAKHAGGAREAAGGWMRRLAQTWALRRAGFDFVVLASPGYHPRQVRQARLLAPREIVAFAPPGEKPPGISRPVAWTAQPTRHHVEETFAILGAFGIGGPIPPLRTAIPPPAPRAAVPPVVGLHASARRPRNRWPAERFAQLARALHERHGARLRLFWSPGAEDDPRHPGDDGKARRIVEATAGCDLVPVPTGRLEELIAGLAACDLVVCSDGGALHVAAALARPIVCFFGDTEPAKWGPWGVPSRVLRPESRDVADVTVEEALAAYEALAPGMRG